MTAKTATSLLVLPALALLGAGTAHAFELGIRLDDFFTAMETSVTGAGLLIGLIGGSGVVLAKMENAYGQFFSGFLNFFISAGVLGGLAAILGTLGLVNGAVL